MTEPIMDRPPLGVNAPGTLFPGLYGDTPGDQRSGADITGQPLPPLNPEHDGPPVLPGTNAAATDVTAPPPGQMEPEREAVAEVEPPRTRKGRSLQDRIDTLTRRYRQEQSTRAGLETQMESLMGLIQQQNDKINELGRAPRAYSASTPAADPLGLGDSAAPLVQPTPNPAVPFALDDVEKVVGRAIETYDRRAREQNNAAAAHRAAHESSFNEATEEMPELADQRTRARKLFNQLYDESPLRALPDGPYQIALQVRGLLSAEGGAANPAMVADRKRQASVVAPQPSATDVPNVNVAGATQELASLAARMRAGENDFRVYKRWRQLREVVRNNK